MALGWQLEMGAQVLGGDRVRFRVWAPAARSVQVEVYPWPSGVERHAMSRDGDGVWSAEIDAAPGALYRYRLDNQWSYPDPCSRSQPEGVHGPSQVVDPAAFRWNDDGWPGLDATTLATYELHVGTFTPEGTFDAVIGQLDALAGLGVTALELMPVAEFPGRRSWGYDGVDLYAPSSVYGGPEGLRRLVDAAHARGLGVVLDAVYNHLGPDGNYLRSFSPYYFTDRHHTPWGDAFNFDGEESAHVRRFFVENALYWQHEFHIDGLRIDATHHFYDDSPKHILREIAAAVHEPVPGGRPFLLTAEDERNELRLLLPPDRDGYGFDGLWVDDFHHCVHVLLTGERDGYFEAYQGTTDELARLLRDGFVFHSLRGERAPEVAATLPAYRLVYSLQNHDQVGNRPFSKRLLQVVDIEPAKAAIALLLLSPCAPLIFMGSEFASSKPFFYFTDHTSEVAARITRSRLEELARLWSASDPAQLPDPQDEATFLQCKLDLAEREQPLHSGIFRLYRELLWLRRDDPVLRSNDRARLRVEALTPTVLALERWNDAGDRRLLVVNFGDAARVDLAALSSERAWRPVLSTADERFAGPGSTPDGLGLAPGAASVELPPRCAVLWQSA